MEMTTSHIENFISMGYPADNGEWYLPGNNNKLPGRLSMNDVEKDIRLQLFTKEYLDGTGACIPGCSEFATFHPIVLGDARSAYTLYNCVWAGTNEIGGSK
jgi:hypothetical protein